jgi:hypothetical protein
MMLFIDTQYTDLGDGELISLGMVSKNLEHEFYAERLDFNRDACSESLKAQIFPLLGKIPDAQLTDSQLAERMYTWFGNLPQKITLAGYSLIELNLMWGAFSGKTPSNQFTDYYLRKLNKGPAYHESIEKYLEIEGRSPYHALDAARAKRAGWVAWEFSNQKWAELQSQKRWLGETF